MQDSNWSQRKKLSVYIVLFFIIIGMAYFLYIKYQVYKTPVQSCKDNIQNQDEKGVDCEGVCVIFCKNSIRPIKSLYTKIIPSKYGVYDIVSMIENVNVGKSTGLQSYKVKIYNDNREQIKVMEGKVYITDAIKFPIILLGQSISGTPKFAEIELADQDYIPVVNHVNRVKVVDYKYDSQEKKLHVKLRNTTLDKSARLTVKALIINDSGVVATNESRASAMNGESESEVNMTWHESIDGLSIYRVEIYVLEDN